MVENRISEERGIEKLIMALRTQYVQHWSGVIKPDVF